jgi:hypothetical protein
MFVQMITAAKNLPRILHAGGVHACLSVYNERVILCLWVYDLPEGEIEVAESQPFLDLVVTKGASRVDMVLLLLKVSNPELLEALVTDKGDVHGQVARHNSSKPRRLVGKHFTDHVDASITWQMEATRLRGASWLDGISSECYAITCTIDALAHKLVSTHWVATSSGYSFSVYSKELTLRADGRFDPLLGFHIEVTVKEPRGAELFDAVEAKLRPHYPHMWVPEHGQLRTEKGPRHDWLHLHTVTWVSPTSGIDPRSG